MWKNKNKKRALSEAFKAVRFSSQQLLMPVLSSDFVKHIFEVLCTDLSGAD
jgi:hypothetical protein